MKTPVALVVGVAMPYPQTSPLPSQDVLDYAIAFTPSDVTPKGVLPPRHGLESNGRD